MILVTGGTGFTGSHVLFQLYRRKLSARVVKRGSSSLENVRAAWFYYRSAGFSLPSFEEYVRYFEWIDCDLRDFYDLEKCLDGIDEIFHIAAFVSYKGSEKREIRDINTGVTANLVNLALQKNIQRFHHVSSIASLQRNEQNLISEVSKDGNADFSTLYSKSKYLGEMEVWRGYEEGLKGIIINPGVIIGPGIPGRGSLQIFSLIRNGFLFYTGGSNGYVDVRDAASFLVGFSRDEKWYNDRYMLVSGTLAYKELFEKIALLSGVKPPRIRAGKIPGLLIGYLAPFISFLTGREIPVTPQIARLSDRHYRFDNSKTIGLPGFTYIPLDKSIADTCKFIDSYDSFKIKNDGE